MRKRKHNDDEKSSFYSSRRPTKRRADRVKKNEDEKIISEFFMSIQNRSNNKSFYKKSTNYLMALSQFMCCVARNVFKIRTYFRILDSTVFPILRDLENNEKDVPAAFHFVVEGIIKICIASLRVLFSKKGDIQYESVCKVLRVLFRFLSLPYVEGNGEEKEDEKNHDFFFNNIPESEAMVLEFTMDDVERSRIRNAFSSKETWDHEHLLLLNTSTSENDLSAYARCVLDTDDIAIQMFSSCEKLIQEYMIMRNKDRRSELAKVSSDLLRILKFVRKGNKALRSSSFRVLTRILEEKEQKEMKKNADLHNRACDLMLYVLKESCRMPNLIQSSSLARSWILDSIEIASSNYDFVHRNLLIHASLTIMYVLTTTADEVVAFDRLEKKEKNEFDFLIDMIVFSLKMMREAMFEDKAENTSKIRFLAFEDFRDLPLANTNFTIQLGTIRIDDDHFSKILGNSSSLKKTTSFFDILVAMLKRFLLENMTKMCDASSKEFQLVREISSFVCSASSSSRAFSTHFRSHLKKSHVSTLLRMMIQLSKRTTKYVHLSETEESIRNIFFTMIRIDAFDDMLEWYVCV